jgi:Zn-dependent protease with chaperone function
MATNHMATYYNQGGRFYQASIFVSTVTVTIRYRDEQHQEKDVHWLEKDIIAFEERGAEAELQYRNAQGQLERLVMRDQDLIASVKKNLRHNRHIGKVHHRLFNTMGSKVAIVFGIVVAVILIVYLWFVPWLGERIAMNFSKEYEISLGEQMYKSMAGTFKIDAGKTKVLNEFYRQLHYQVDYPIQITVVESGEMNAFAIPGGHIVVYDAILERMKTPEELAALLGHEASHIALRHSLRNMFRSLARKMFLSLVIGSDAGIVAVLVDNADNLKGLEYSRSLETDADNNGLKLMSKSGIDVQGMVRLMELLKKESGSAQPAAFLNTHPVFNDRIENIKEQVRRLPATSKEQPELKKLFHAIYENF